MKKLINQVRVLALAAALTAGFMSFGPADANARGVEIAPDGGGIVCFPDTVICFNKYDDNGNPNGHVHGERHNPTSN